MNDREGWSLLAGFDIVFFFQAEDGIRDLVRSRGLGDVYKRQPVRHPSGGGCVPPAHRRSPSEGIGPAPQGLKPRRCLLYTSDAADDLRCVDLGGRRIIKKKKRNTYKMDERV